MSRAKIGTSGWNYDEWIGKFYPSKINKKKELEYVSKIFPTVEVNGTFYSLKHCHNFKQWYEITPTDFIFSIKANRFITHVKKLNDVESPLANFFASGILILKEKLGPILWQLPPNMSFNPVMLEKFLRILPKNFNEAVRIGSKSKMPRDRKFLKITKNLRIRHAMEIRNNTFLNPWFIEIAKKYKVAVVFSDTAGKWPYFEDITADFIYIRLHGENKMYSSSYSNDAIQFWGKRIITWKEGGAPKDTVTITDNKFKQRKRDVYVYFDNDVNANAPLDAKRLIQNIARLNPKGRS